MSQSTGLDAVVALARTQDFVITREQALSKGMTAAVWRGGARGRLVPVMRGVCMVGAYGGPRKPGPRQLARAALLASGTEDETLCLCLGSALRLLGIQGTPAREDEHLLTRRDGGWQRRHGVRRHCFDVAETDIVTASGIRLTGAERSVYDAMRTYDRLHAVSVLDSALHLGRIGDASLDRLRLSLTGERRTWVDLADPKAESPLETRVRILLFIDRGVAFRSQVWVQLADYGRARLDFLLGDLTVVECDGKDEHDGPVPAARDRKRDRALKKLGHEVKRVTWSDAMHEADATFERLMEALARTG